MPAAPGEDSLGLPPPFARGEPWRAVPLSGESLVAEFLASHSSATVASYGRSLADFARHAGAPSIAAAAAALLAGGAGAANRRLLSYRAALAARGLAPVTINVRLSAVRSLVAFARLAGIVEWTLAVRGVRAAPYRDTRGPSRTAVRRMLQETGSSASPKSVRDHAVLRLLIDLGLRRAEVVTLDREHVDLLAERVHVLGKGHRERIALTLPAPTKAALAAWLAVRGEEAGPLLPALRRGGALRRRRDATLQRIAGADVYRIVGAASLAAGLGRVRPHALRHYAVTAALDATGGDVRRVRAFSRHADVRTVLRYDDARNDAAGEVAALVAAQVGAATSAVAHRPHSA